MAMHRVGVTTQPEVKVVELTPNDSFIVLASDGVWEFISNQEVVDIIADARTVEEGCRAVSDHAWWKMPLFLHCMQVLP